MLLSPKLTQLHSIKIPSQRLRQDERMNYLINNQYVTALYVLCDHAHEIINSTMKIP